jgi:acetylornithine deacetylase/succinyl-diaminopimelate desuccinylase-like protein
LEKNTNFKNPFQRFFRMVEATEILRKLVSIKSIFPEEKEIGKFIAEYLEEKGFKVKKQSISKDPERFNVLAEKGEGKALLLYGHIDTVKAYHGWKNNPFELYEEDDKLFGLGALDMKAGCAAFLNAIDNFEPESYKLKLAFGVDEENISEGAHTLAKDGFMKDVVAVLVSEPAIGTKDHQGARMITLGRRGRCDIEINVDGKSAHGAYNSGINAIEEASKIILELNNLELTENDIGKANLFCRKIYADSESLSIPEKCIIHIDRHLVSHETPETAVKQINEMIERMKENNILKGNAVAALKQRKTPFLKPYITSKDHPFTKFVENCVREEFGEVYHNYGYSVADDNIFGAELKLPVITIGPKGAGAHSSEEYVLKSSYLELIKIYRKILKEFNKHLR